MQLVQSMLVLENTMHLGFIIEEMNSTYFLLVGLFHQFAVGQFAKYEHANIHFIKNNQKHLLVEVYSGLIDQIHAGTPMANKDQKVILPSSFSGGPWQI
jgi:hypothetical protein